MKKSKHSLCEKSSKLDKKYAVLLEEHGNSLH